MKALRFVLSALLCWSLTAADAVDRMVDRLRASTPDQLLATEAFHRALNEAYRGRDDWRIEQRAAWQLHLARAAIYAELHEAAATALAAAADHGLPGDLRRQHQLLFIEWWRLRVGIDPQAVEPEHLVEHLRAADAETAVLVQAALAESRRLRQIDRHAQALERCNAALGLLAEAPVEDRSAVYHECLQVMESAGWRADDMLRWFTARDDPATRLVSDTVATAALALIGQPLPTVALPRLDADADAEVWAGAALGGPTLLYFHAFWSPSCLAINPVIADLAEAYPDLRVVAISLHLDGQEAAARAYAEAHELPGILVGDGSGWEMPLLQHLAIAAIPQVVLVGVDGIIVDTSLVVGDPELSARRLGDALDRWLGHKQEDEP